MNSYDPGTGERYRIDTPERVDLEYDLAGLGSRLLAALVDTALLTVLYLLVFLLGAFALSLVGSTLGQAIESSGIDVDSGAISTGLVAFTVLLSFLVFWGYYLFFEMVWHGQSPGKRWVGLRVIKEGGYPIGFSESAIRNLVRLVDFLPAYYGIGAISVFIDRRCRRLGDLAAGTLVVKERRDARLESLGVSAPAEPPAGSDQEAGESPDLSALTAADQSLLREYLARRQSLEPEAAARLAASIAGALAARAKRDLGGETPEAFLLGLARELGLEQ